MHTRIAAPVLVAFLWFAFSAIMMAADGKADAAGGPFLPTWESFAEHYEFPQWFRDAKFGIWSVWSPECVGGAGDHYNRTIYKQGGPVYQSHIMHYGHPSVFGYKDVINEFKAEKWDPKSLMALYKRAGAKYFVMMANHHDNFDMFDSAHQPWNSVNMGPKKDIAGIWAECARAEGLRFGMTIHSWQAWRFYEQIRGADTNGPWAGVSYDWAMTKADGKGKWWETFDPQDLYCQNHKPGEPENDEYYRNFNLRMHDIIDKYQPDLMYFDNYDRSPYGGEGAMQEIAYFYNRGIRNGKTDVVFNRKHIPENYRKGMVWDVERGLLDEIQPYPWQIDTCIGVWHYDYSASYKSAETVLFILADVVSKNGNLLLNIPIKGDGSHDPYEILLLEELATWFTVNGDAIYATRPWTIFGEGGQAPDPKMGYSWNEDKKVTALRGQVRYTTKGNALYALILGAPSDRKVVMRALARSAGGKTNSIIDVTLLGYPGKIKWCQDENGLEVTLPETLPARHVLSLKISGQDLKAVGGHLTPSDSKQ